MRLKFKQSFVFFFMALVLINFNAFGQGRHNARKADTLKAANIDTLCNAKYESIKDEYQKGHLTKVDSLFAAYQGSPCFQISAANQLLIKKVLKIIIAQKRLDNNSIHEVDSLQKKLDAINKRFPDRIDTAYYRFRIGPSGSLFLSNLGGPPGWTSGVMFGLDFQNTDHTGFGFNLGAYYQKMPFSIDDNANTTAYAVLTQNGFLFVTAGHISLDEFPVTFSYNFQEPKPGGLGFGLFAGAEWLNVRSDTVTDYHYIWNYMVSGHNGIVYTSTFEDNPVNLPNQKNSPVFFSTRHYTNLIIGANFYWQIYDRLLFTFSPEYHQIVGGELMVNNEQFIYHTLPYSYTTDHPYGLSPDNFMLRVTCSYLFGKTKKPGNQ